jgi:pre-mRNA-processing factor 8
MDLDEA